MIQIVIKHHNDTATTANPPQPQPQPATATVSNQPLCIMSGPLVKFVAQALSVGVAVFSRAFMVAYQQAVANAKTGGAQAAQAAKQATSKKLMHKSEALGILNLEEGYTMKKVDSQFNRYFDANEPNKGGSYYLQSKIYRAKEMLEEFEKEQAEELKGGPKR